MFAAETAQSSDLETRQMLSIQTGLMKSTMNDENGATWVQTGRQVPRIGPNEMHGVTKPLGQVL